MDLITWHPAVGGSTDPYGLWDIPGATSLDGVSQCIGDESRIQWGINAYSDIPTWAEIDDGSDLNQWIALHNRLINQYIDQFGYIVEDVSNTTPIMLGVRAAFYYGTLNDNRVTIRGCTGNTAANGTWTIVWDHTTSGIYYYRLVGSVGNGAYTGGGKVEQKSPLAYGNPDETKITTEKFARIVGDPWSGDGMYALRKILGLPPWSITPPTNAPKYWILESYYSFPDSSMPFPRTGYHNRGLNIKGNTFAEMRQMIALVGMQTINSRFQYQYRRVNPDTTYPGTSGASENWYSLDSTYNIGKTYDLYYRYVYRWRQLHWLAIPDWMSDFADQIVSANIIMRLAHGFGSENYDVGLYQSDINTFPGLLTPAFAGSAYHTTTLLGSVNRASLSPTYTDFSFSFSPTTLKNNAGQLLQFILATTQEVAGGGVANQDASATTSVPLRIEINWGS